MPQNVSSSMQLLFQITESDAIEIVIWL